MRKHVLSVYDYDLSGMLGSEAPIDERPKLPEMALHQILWSVDTAEVIGKSIRPLLITSSARFVSLFFFEFSSMRHIIVISG